MANSTITFGTAIAVLLSMASAANAQPRYLDHVVVPPSPYAGKVQPERPVRPKSSTIIQFGIQPTQTSEIKPEREESQRENDEPPDRD